MAFKFTDDNFKSEVLESDVPVLVDFYADWCGPCKMMGPVVEALAEKYQGKIKIGKINTDENPKSAQEYKVMTIPTFLFVKNGEIVEKISAVMDQDAMESKLNEML